MFHPDESDDLDDLYEICKESGKYCPICERIIYPIKVNDDLIWVHDEIDHSDEDLAAWDIGLQ